MENTLYLCLLAWFFVALVVNVTEPSANWLVQVTISSVGVSLVRPEGMFVLISVVIVCLLAGPITKVKIGVLAAAAVGLGTTIAQVVRFVLSLGPFPNPVRAKQSLGLSERLEDGLGYLSKSFFEMPGTMSICAAIFGLVLFRTITGSVKEPIRPIVTIGFYIAGAVGSFALLSGGDWMEYGRFLVPTFTFTLLSGMILFEGRKAIALCVALISVSAIEVVRFSRASFGGFPIWASYDAEFENFTPSFLDRFNAIHARDLSFVDNTLGLLADDPRQEISFGSFQAGTVAYYLFKNTDKTLEFIDFAGLASDHAIGCKTWGRANAIELADYVECLGTKPDYVFNLDWGNGDDIARWNNLGCRTVIDEKLAIDVWAWKRPSVSRQYLVKCS